MLLRDVLYFNARKAPQEYALFYQDQAFTWSRMKERANRIGNAVLGLNSPGVPVSILSQNCPEFVECYYGVPLAGAPLALINYRLHIQEVIRTINNAGSSILITEEDFAEIVNEFRQEMPLVKHVISIGGGPGTIDYESWLSSASSADLNVPMSDTDLAAILFSSGTTGAPKGIMHTHKSIVAASVNYLIAWGLSRDDRFLLFAPLCLTTYSAIIAMALRRIPVVLMRDFDVDVFLSYFEWETIEKCRITKSAIAPTILNFIMRHPDIGRYDFSNLRYITYGGQPMSVELLKQAISRFGNIFLHSFGMAELIGVSTILTREDHMVACTEKPHLLRSVGKPMALCSMRIVNEQMEDVKPGEVGEIVIRGDQLLTGYWQEPERTAKAFEGGWFHTEDLGKYDGEGYFYVVDRLKDMIKTGGMNVFPQEVEQVIYRHPSVYETAVIGEPDETWGENILALVVLKPGMTATVEEIIGYCKENLAGYKKPKRVVFVDELPKNASMKILKKELRQMYAGKTPGNPA